VAVDDIKWSGYFQTVQEVTCILASYWAINFQVILLTDCGLTTP